MGRHGDMGQGNDHSKALPYRYADLIVLTTFKCIVQPNCVVDCLV